ncbi:MAG TPA: TetR/AcrR family transcriptional regulator [Gammaproteobacteria bacterium]|nr:TetR/AcrR family transcriptional regulator [Gammaproteobacteria bacterium]
MSTANVEQPTEAIRQQILAAADNLFRHYGYNKTTMVEIAEDIGMSAANLYRYFANKQDIVHECARRYMAERIALLREAVSKPDLTAGERLEHYILTTLYFSRNLASENKKIGELVETITEQRPDLVHNRIESEIALIREILELGNETGEFTVKNLSESARTVHTCLIIFEVPIFMSIYSLEQFEQLARSVVDTLINGLRSPGKNSGDICY